MSPRLSPLERSTLDAFAAATRRRFGARLLRLELFGSRARGQGRDDSDLDLFVAVAGLTRAERHAVIDEAADLGVASGLVLSPLVVDAAAPLGPSLAEDIAREGVPL